MMNRRGCERVAVGKQPHLQDLQEEAVYLHPLAAPMSHVT